MDRKPKVYYVIGHGSADSGTTAVNGTFERDINLNVGLKAHQLSLDAGWFSKCNRMTKDVPNWDVVLGEIKAFSPDIVVNIHHNSFNKNAKGFDIFYQINIPASKDYAVALANAYKSVMGQVSHGAEYKTLRRSIFKPNEDYYFCLRDISALEFPAILSEFCFIDSPVDWEKIDTIEEQNNEAYAIVTALSKVFNYTKPVPVYPFAPPISPPKTPMIGGKIKIVASDARYIEGGIVGRKVPDQYKNKEYTIQIVKSDRILIKELFSWVFVKDCQLL